MQDIKNIDIRSTNSSSFNPKNKNKIPDITFKNQQDLKDKMRQRTLNLKRYKFLKSKEIEIITEKIIRL